MDEARIDNLADAVDAYDFAYLLTVDDGGHPHAVAVRPRLVGGHIGLTDAGSKSRRNLRERSVVSLVWPPGSIDKYSLIVDGSAVVGLGERIEITPTRAVLHRPGVPGDIADPSASGGAGVPGGAVGCASGCRELDLPA